MTTHLRNVAEVGRQAYWTRDRIITAIQRWNELYGEPPRSADWNPSAAKWSASSWRIERYRAGDPETGAAWPSLNAAKKAFGGSISAAIEAAGLEPNKPGPKSRKDVGPEVVERLPSDVRIAIEAYEARVREADERVRVLEAKLARSYAARDRYIEERDIARRTARKRETVVRTRTKTKTVVREDARARKRVEKLEGDLREAKVALTEARLEMAAARRDATRMASKLERAESTISELRRDRREIRHDLTRAEDRAEAHRKTIERLKAEATTAPAPEVIVKVEKEIVELAAPEAAEVEAARALAASAENRIEAAELRAATAEREYREIAEAATGEARRLTAAEMKALREGGPSGPAVFADAVRELAAARAKGGRALTKAALWSVASAAIRWRDRL